MRFIVSAILALALSACASTPTNPQQAVFAAKQSYAVALTVAVAYKKLPTCAPTAPPLCSKPDVVATLQKVDTASSALLNAAENTVRTQGAGANAQTAIKAAEQAVSAFVTITAALAVK
jgi:hypothetical protein